MPLPAPDDVTREHPVTIVGSLGSGVAPALGGGATGGGAGGLHVVIRTRSPWALDVGGREGVYGNDLRTLGCVLAGVRYDPKGPWYARGGFAHHHETPMDLALEFPVQAALGSLVGIRHRSGLDLAAGVDVSLADVLPDGFGGLGVVAEASVAAFPDPYGPRAYAMLDLGVSLDVGKRAP